MSKDVAENKDPASCRVRRLSAFSLALCASYWLEMTYPLFSACRLVLGTLYPAYASYKAVRTKNVREYVSVTCTTYQPESYVYLFF